MITILGSMVNIMGGGLHLHDGISCIFPKRLTMDEITKLMHGNQEHQMKSPNYLINNGINDYKFVQPSMCGFITLMIVANAPLLK